MSVRILIGDCRAVLRALPDESVHCIVTSPPYYGLRDYGTAQWDGGKPDCDHRQGRPGAGRADGIVDDRAQRNRDGIGAMGGDCRKCGAHRIDNQIGLEETPDAYVKELVCIFRECRRVLRNDGTLWINLGDSYNNFRIGQVGQSVHNHEARAKPTEKRRGYAGLKEKDLIGVPWLVAFALRADGWYLRQDIIWSKPNPMPESVTDRCTKAHEYLFLLSKSARYYFDQDAVREPGITTAEEAASKWKARRNGVGKGQEEGVYHSYKTVTPFQNDPNPLGRNKRSVWEVATQPFSKAHFATFPPKLIEPCIKAGCPIGGTVLDPFGGAGTTALVADRLQRNSILIELNPTYAAMAEERIAVDAGILNTGIHVEVAA